MIRIIMSIYQHETGYKLYLGPNDWSIALNNPLAREIKPVTKILK